MGTTAAVFFDSQLIWSELERVPGRLRTECPSVVERMNDWTEAFAWDFGRRCNRFDAAAAAELWAPYKGIYLFCPVGHLDFWSGGVGWNSFVKTSWLKDAPDRDHLAKQATELARVFEATFGLVTDDSGGDNLVLDVLEAGGSVFDAITSLNETQRAPVPLLGMPFIKSPYYTIQFE